MKLTSEFFLTKFSTYKNICTSFIKRNKRILFCCVFALLFCISAIFAIILSSSGKSSLELFFNNSKSSLFAVNRNAKKAQMHKGYAYFRFTEEQKKIIEQQKNQNEMLALSVSVKVKKKSEKELTKLALQNTMQPFSLGFLYEDDFINYKKLKTQIDGRPLVSVDLVSFISENDENFTVAFCFEKTKTDFLDNLLDAEKKSFPVGFFIYSSQSIFIEKAQIIPAVIGFDKKTNFFSYASNGGTVSKDFASFDFSGASQVFSVQNTDNSLMPIFSLELKAQETENAQLNVIFNGKKITFYRHAKTEENFTLPSASLESPFSNVVIENPTEVNSLLLCNADPKLLQKQDGNVLYPYTCDPGLIINWKQSSWRGKNYELFEWQQFPGVLYFDTKNYSIQNDFFRRLAFFVEKQGYRGKLLTDVQLENMHAYNAHDYSAKSLAEFFSVAENLGFALNQSEYLLKDILLANGVIVKNSNGTFDAGRGAVISISQESPEYLRRTFIAHEGWHGIFFVDADYRNAVAAVYYTMDQLSLTFLKQFWSTQKGLQYDLNDEYLMHNELMAYLMQQPIKSVASYFLSRAKWTSVQKNQKASADYIIKTSAVGLEDAASVLDSYAQDNWGFKAGRVWKVSR